MAPRGASAADPPRFRGAETEGRGSQLSLQLHRELHDSAGAEPELSTTGSGCRLSAKPRFVGQWKLVSHLTCRVAEGPHVEKMLSADLRSPEFGV